MSELNFKLWFMFCVLCGGAISGFVVWYLLELLEVISK